jgi:Flp pilus assembly protein TadD
LIDLGRLKEAREKLRERPAAEGERPRLLLFEGMILYREKQYAASIATLERARGLQDGDPNVYKLLGLNLVSMGQEELAGGYFARAVELAPRDFMARYYLGLHQLTSKQAALAEASSQAAIRLNPNYPDAWLLLGVAQEQVGREEEAVRTYRRAGEIVEQQQLATEMPFLYLARLLISLGRVEESLPPLEKAAALNPKSAEARALRGQTLGRLGRYESAVQSLQEAVRLSPQDKSLHTDGSLSEAGPNRRRATGITAFPGARRTGNQKALKFR